MSAGLVEILGPAYADLAERIEGDLDDHVAELNERRRNLLTTRGFGITSVSALLTAAVVSGQALLAGFAIVVVFAIAYIDLEAHRRIQAIERRLPFLEKIDRLVRRGLALESTTLPTVRALKSELRTYKRTPPGTDEVPWGISPRWPATLKPFGFRRPYLRAPGALNAWDALGPFGLLYGALCVGCVALGISTLLAKTKVEAVVTCVVPGGTDLRAATREARCSNSSGRAPLMQLTPRSRPVSSYCVVPPALSGWRLVVHCTGAEGVIAVEIRHGRTAVRTRPAVIGAEGRVVLAVGHLRRGWSYTVTITDNTGVLAAASPLKIA